jgi:hypothetical protein
MLHVYTPTSFGALKVTAVVVPEDVVDCTGGDNTGPRVLRKTIKTVPCDGKSLNRTVIDGADSMIAFLDGVGGKI